MALLLLYYWFPQVGGEYQNHPGLFVTKPMAAKNGIQDRGPPCRCQDKSKASETVLIIPRLSVCLSVSLMGEIRIVRMVKKQIL